MTTPATNTAQWIIRSAMRDAGYLMKGAEPSSEDYAENLARLNEIVNLWQTQGIKLFLLQDLSVTLVAGTSTYTFGPSGSTVMTRPLRVIEAYYSDANGVRRPLMPLAWADWVRLSQVAQEGQPNAYFVDKQATQLSVSFWLTPDTTAATGTVHLIAQTQATNFASLSDASAFPIEWAAALRWGLADEIATGQPQVIMDRCERRARYYRNLLEDWDREDAPLILTPDRQGGYQTGSFR